MLFDGLMTDLPETGRYLSSTAEIIQDHVFESAVVKILNGAEQTLTRGEGQKVQHLLLDDNDNNDHGDESTNHESEDFATALLKDAEKRKAPRLQQRLSRYVKLNHFTPTSNKCERLFSLTKILLSDRRKSMEPYHLELSVFLRANKDLWNEFTIDEMLKARPPVASAVSPEAPVANDDEVEEEDTEL